MCPSIGKVEQHAGRLGEAIPEPLASAHGRAHAVHLVARLKKRSPNGATLAEAVRENLADAARELGEAVREVRGYEYAVINDHALFPYKYADRPNPSNVHGWQPTPPAGRCS